MPKKETLTIRIAEDKFKICMEDLTWGELVEMEDMLGGSIDGANLESAKGVLALAFIAAKRTKPLVSLDELKALPLGEIELVEGEVDALPPTSVVEAEVSGSQ